MSNIIRFGFVYAIPSDADDEVWEALNPDDDDEFDEDESFARCQRSKCRKIYQLHKKIAHPSLTLAITSYN